MKCPLCGAKTQVLDTRDVVRRRQCVGAAAHVFTTIENVYRVGERPQGRPRKISPSRYDHLR